MSLSVPQRMLTAVWDPSMCILTGRTEVRVEGQVCRLGSLLGKGRRGEARLPLADAHKPIEANMAAAIGACAEPRSEFTRDCGERQRRFEAQMGQMTSHEMMSASP